MDILLGFEPKDPGSNPGGSVMHMPRKFRPACSCSRYSPMNSGIIAYSRSNTGISSVDRLAVTRGVGVFYEKINYLDVL